MDKPQGTIKAVIIAVGLPGSGKTTFLRVHAAEIGATYICPDDLRQQLLGDATDQSQNAHIWSHVYAQIEEALRHGDVVVDGMGVDPVYRRSDVARYKQLGASVIAYHFVTPLEVCLERNRLRPRHVAEEVIRTAHQQLLAHPPTEAEGFDKIIEIETT